MICSVFLLLLLADACLESVSSLKLLVTHLIQYKYGSMEVYRKSLVRSQVQIMQNEKTDTFESLYPAINGSKRLKKHDNLTPKQTKFR